MTRGIYALTDGMITDIDLFKKNAYNMSNANTPGFKASGMNLAEAKEFEQYIIGGDGRLIGELGVGPVIEERFLNYTQGHVQYTGNEYDFALQSKQGMFAVQTENGIRYQRAGNFMVNGDNKLVNQFGDAVLDENYQEINIPQGSKVSVRADGTLSPNNVKLGVFDGEYRHVGGNLYVTENATPGVNYTVFGNSVEGSNYNPIEGSIDMVLLQREMQMKQNLLKQQDDENKQLIQAIG